MRLNSEKFFNEEEKVLIKNTINDIEKKTSGEIVVMVVDSSDGYEDIDAVVGILFSAALSIVPAEFVYEKSAHYLAKLLPNLHWTSSIPDEARFISALLFFIAMTAVFHVPFRYLVSRTVWIRRLFLDDRRKEREIKKRAMQVFHQQNLHNTEDGTGILFLISLLERKVYVLADRGIYHKISQSDLDGYASSVANGIAHKRAATSLCEAIRTIGADLAEHFPVKNKNPNELSNNIITE